MHKSITRSLDELFSSFFLSENKGRLWKKIFPDPNLHKTPWLGFVKGGLLDVAPSRNQSSSFVYHFTGKNNKLCRSEWKYQQARHL